VTPRTSQHIPEKYKVLYNNVTESDIEAMFDYSVDKDIISDHWDDTMEVIRKSEEVFPTYKPTENDLMSIKATIPTMTLVSLVNESKTLQSLVDLGVQLHNWDSIGELGLAAKLDFERDVAPVVRFLADVGVKHEDICEILTLCPRILEETEDDLRTRIAYLVSKKFTRDEISHIITSSSTWLAFPVRSIDARLGFFQKSLGFLGNEVRRMTVECPDLITWSGTPGQVRHVMFSLNEEMGFSQEEIKEMTLSCPKILKRWNLDTFAKNFELLHNDCKIPHDILCKFPESLLLPWYVYKPRIQLLESIGRAQFDPTQPNYVSPDMLTGGEDAEFCEEVAKVPLKLFDQFQKTL